MTTTDKSATSFRAASILGVDGTAIARLKQDALANPKKRARLCLHEDHNDPIQEMVIALVSGHPVTAHRQLGLRKSYHILDGSLRVTFYSDQGARETQYTLTPHSAGASILTFPAGQWHACEAISDIAVFLEIIPGPYDSARTEWRDWTP